MGDIGAAHARLTARGISFDVGPLMEGRIDGVEIWTAFFRDPDGNRLALVEERRPG